MKTLKGYYSVGAIGKREGGAIAEWERVLTGHVMGARKGARGVCGCSNGMLR